VSDRISKDQYGMQLAHTVKKRSSCIRRQVGCVLVDAQGIILATGYNGPAKGLPECEYNKRCTTPVEHTVGEDLHKCQAIHAEQNALMFCSDIRKIRICYTTTSPCLHCIKMLLNTGCESIIYEDLYDEEAMSMWDERRLSYVIDS